MVRLEALLVFRVDRSYLMQPAIGVQLSHRIRKDLRQDASSLQFPNQLLQDLDEAGAVDQRLVVYKGQLVHHSPNQTVLNRLAQLGVDLSGVGEAFGIQAVKGEEAYAYGAPNLSQTSAPGAYLQVGGHDDVRRGLQAHGRITNSAQHICSFAGPGRGKIEMD